MQKQDINNLIREALEILKTSSHDISNQEPSGTSTLNQGNPKTESIRDYWETAKRIFGEDPDTKKMIPPTTAITVFNAVKKANKLSTLRKSARSVRYVATEWLKHKADCAEISMKAGKWSEVERIVTDASFVVLMQLAKMMPAEYRKNWTPQSCRKSKKVSLSRLPKDWREQMAEAGPEGQFMIPMLVALMSGVRPAELEYGVKLKRFQDQLTVHIKGAKVTKYAGQTAREFTIANHPVKDRIIAYMDTQENKNELLVKVDCGNSVTTYMRAIGKKLWPAKEAITVYSARHAMAADCKSASHNPGDDPDLASKVLGHRVDKTASYYGSLFQSGGISVAPSNVMVTHPVKNKSKAKNTLRKTPSQLKKISQGLVM
jgi:hypothetical protein